MKAIIIPLGVIGIAMFSVGLWMRLTETEISRQESLREILTHLLLIGGPIIAFLYPAILL